jgi:hypothetical protein
MNSNRSGRRYDREFKNNAVALVRGGSVCPPGAAHGSGLCPCGFGAAAPQNPRPVFIKPAFQGAWRIMAPTPGKLRSQSQGATEGVTLA